MAGDYSAVDALPCLDASSTSGLGDGHLLRAALLLGNIAHAAYYFSPTTRGVVPAAVLAPWREVCERLHRPSCALTYLDLFLHNWERRAASDATTITNCNVQADLVVAVPLFRGYGGREEHVFNLTMVDMHARSAALIAAVIDAHTAVLNGAGSRCARFLSCLGCVCCWCLLIVSCARLLFPLYCPPCRRRCGWPAGDTLGYD